MAMFSRGDVIVIAESSTTRSTTVGGYTTARLAVVASVSRDRTAIRAVRLACDQQPSARFAWGDYETAVLPGVTVDTADAFSHVSRYAPAGQLVEWRTPITVCCDGVGHDARVRVGRWLRDAVLAFQAGGPVPKGLNPASPGWVHLDAFDRAAAEAVEEQAMWALASAAVTRLR